MCGMADGSRRTAGRDRQSGGPTAHQPNVSQSAAVLCCTRCLWRTVSVAPSLSSFTHHQLRPLSARFCRTLPHDFIATRGDEPQAHVRRWGWRWQRRRRNGYAGHGNVRRREYTIFFRAPHHTSAHCMPALLCPALSAAYRSFQLTHRIGNILLPGLNIVTVPQYLSLCVLTALLCLFKEYLVAHRIQLSRTARSRRKTSNVPSLSPPTSGDVNEHDADNEHTLPLMSPSASRPLLTPSTTASSLLTAYYPSLMYAANMLLAYVVMLLVMSYNVGLIAVIVVASAVGHYYFTRPDDVDDSRRPWIRDGSDGRGRSRSKAKQQMVSRRGQMEKGSERMELTVDEDPHNEEDWLAKDCCEQ